MVTARNTRTIVVSIVFAGLTLFTLGALRSPETLLGLAFLGLQATGWQGKPRRLCTWQRKLPADCGLGPSLS
jgi:hypothetical protein